MGDHGGPKLLEALEVIASVPQIGPLARFCSPSPLPPASQPQSGAHTVDGSGILGVREGLGTNFFKGERPLFDDVLDRILGHLVLTPMRLGVLALQLHEVTW